MIEYSKGIYRTLANNNASFGHKIVQNVYTSVAAAFWMGERDVSATTTSVTISDCYYKFSQYNDVGVNNSNMIPLRIYGIKIIT